MDGLTLFPGFSAFCLVAFVLEDMERTSLRNCCIRVVLGDNPNYPPEGNGVHLDRVSHTETPGRVVNIAVSG